MRKQKINWESIILLLIGALYKNQTIK